MSPSNEMLPIHCVMYVLAMILLPIGEMGGELHGGFSSLGCARCAWLDRGHHRHESEGFPHRLSLIHI